jgi:hypothetical protein
VENLFDWFDWDALLTAIDMARVAHAGQVDKAGEPYICHVLRVGMSLLPDMGAAVAGVLHDILEDSNFKPETLDTFGERIVNAVVALTREPTQSYEEYIERVYRNELARKVKLADLRDNQDPDRHRRAIANGADPDKIRELQARYAKAIIELESGSLRFGFPGR